MRHTNLAPSSSPPQAKYIAGTRRSLPLARYAGAYAGSLYGEATVSNASDGLRLRAGTLEGTLEHWQYGTFRVRGDQRWLGTDLTTFVLGRDGAEQRPPRRRHGTVSAWSIAVRPESQRRSNPYSRCEATMSILWTIIIGLVVGALAKLVMPGKDPGGIIVTILLGIVGAFLGTFVGRALGMYSAGESAGWIMSLIGAIIVLLIYRMVTGRKGPVT